MQKGKIFCVLINLFFTQMLWIYPLFSQFLKIYLGKFLFIKAPLKLNIALQKEAKRSIIKFNVSFNWDEDVAQSSLYNKSWTLWDICFNWTQCIQALPNAYAMKNSNDDPTIDITSLKQNEKKRFLLFDNQKPTETFYQRLTCLHSAMVFGQPIFKSIYWLSLICVLAVVKIFWQWCG